MRGLSIAKDPGSLEDKMRTPEQVGTEALSADVLVLGGGIAGCFAAAKAREAGLDVVLVDKGNVGRSGLSPTMSGVLTYFDPEKDDYNTWFKECVEAGQWLNDQKCLEGMPNETTGCIRGMESWGAKFQKKDGEFIRTRGVGQIHAQNVLMAHGGLQLMLVLRGEVLRRGVHVVERVMVTDLLTSDGEATTSGRIVGAIGFNIRTGRFYVFRAKATIIATGATLSGNLRCVHPINSGDGRGMAFDIGCEMRNMDLVKLVQRLRDFAGPIGPGANIFVSEGAYLVNAKGDRFMRKWDPQRMERSDRVIVTLAMAVEEKEGRGPVYYDGTHLSEASHNRIERAIPLVIRSLDAVGLNLRKDRIPYTCGLIDTSCGGIKVNDEGAATIPALYSAGDVTDHGDMGVSEIITPGMLSAIVGQRAGKAAAKYAAGIEDPVISEHQVQLLKERIFAPLRRESGLNHNEIRAHCRRILERGLVGPFKNESGLKEAIDIVQEIRENEMPKLVARDYHELARALGIRNELLHLELMARCSLIRTESRGSHRREDYPERDDANWLKWVIAKKKDNGIEVWTEPIPFEEYRLKPGLGK